jgi:cell division protein FtsI (penicillin-binding protein 3)
MILRDNMSGKSDREQDYARSINIFSWDICNNSLRVRLYIVILGFCLCFVGVSYRLISVTTSDYIKSNSYHTKHTGFRKEIVDRNGNLLAINLPSSSLFANPHKVINPEESLAKLSKVLPKLDQKKLLVELKSDKTFVWVKRDLTPKEQEAIFNLGMPGFDFEQEQKRIYSFGKLISHTIGYVGRDFTGLAGFEKSYDKFLTNTDFGINQSDINKPLALTIDVRLQNILNEEMEKTIKEFRAIGGVGIIADPNSGEILAMVSKPDFDPHYPSDAKPEELFNRASLGVYESGSIFKILTMAIGLDTKVTTIEDAYDISYMKIGKYLIKDYHPKKGWHTVPEIFLHSSNIGVSQIALEVGKGDFKTYLKKLGLLDQLKIEVPERGIPLFPSDSRWNDLSTATMSYGYALSISPLHFVQAVLPVVNGGNFYPLTLVKKRDEKPYVATKVFEKETSEHMKQLLRLCVKEGTGKRAEVQGYLVGGKTGTAEKLSGKHYLKNSRVSSFLGVLPVSNPKYVIYIMIDDPQGTKETFGFATAGFTAAPAVARVFERMVALYGIEPVDENSEDAQSVMNVEYKINNEV